MVSPRKPASSASAAPRLENNNNNNNSMSTKSCESLFSASSRESASQIYQRKQLPRTGMKSSSNGAMRQPAMVPSNTNSEIHQRVMSARNLRMKTFQNQLADAQTEIANLAHENRMLRTMHKRQSNALNKYESTGAELPQLLHSHAEELRVWQTKFRNVQAANKDLEVKIKQKEAQILALSDQNKHYSQLNKDRNLDERQKLQEKLRTLEQRLIEKDNDMKLMSRKLQLETKNCRQQLLNEQKRCKEVLLKLEKARLELSGYRKLEEFTLNDKCSGRRAKLNVLEDLDQFESLEKLEKSLETLDSAIEKQNEADFNAMGLSSKSPFYAKKDGDDEDKSSLLSDVPDEEEKPTKPKLVLPPAVKPVGNTTVTGSRPSLNQLLNQNKTNASGSKSTLRQRAGGLPLASASSTTSKRRDANLSLKQATSETKSNKTPKTLEFDYAEDYEQEDAGIDGEEDMDNYGAMGNASEGADDNDEENPNEMSIVNYSTYMETKTEINEMLDMTEEDDYDDDSSSQLTSGDTSKATPVKGNGRPPSMKENMSSIRKQISDDYKERESFLNTFCRQASGSSVRDDPSKKKRNSISTGAPAGQTVGSRKHALLAALKAIDDNKSQD